MITRFSFTSAFTGTRVFILSRDSHSRLYSQVHVHSFYHEIHIHVCINRYMCIHFITRFTFTPVVTATRVFILSRYSHSRLYSQIHVIFSDFGSRKIEICSHRDNSSRKEETENKKMTGSGLEHDEV